MRNVTTRPARSLSTKAPGPGLLFVFLALPLLAARAGEPSGLPRARPEDVGVSSERLHRVDEVMQRHIEEQKISGAVTLVARKGRVVHLEAQGLMDIEAKAPMRTDAIFRMASSTKPVTGVAVMMLVEEGKIRLADPVSKFIPEFKDMKVAVEKDGEVELVPAEREVTIRDLLTHTSGLASGGIGQQKAPPELLRPGGAGATLAEACPASPQSRSTSSRGRAGDTAAWPGSTPWRGSSRSPPGSRSTSSCGSASSSRWG